MIMWQYQWATNYRTINV